jgi:hypothetical protein
MALLARFVPIEARQEQRREGGRSKNLDLSRGRARLRPSRTAVRPRGAMQDIIGSWLRCELTGEKTHGREVGYCTNFRGQDIGEAIIKQRLCSSVPALFGPLHQA